MPQFKTVSVRAYLHAPLGPDATRFALLPQVLRRGCRRTPTLRAITTLLEDLYGASFSADVFKMGEQHVLSLSLEVVNDRYTPRDLRALPRGVEFLGRALCEPVLEGRAFKAEYVRREKENLKFRIEGLIDDRSSYAAERCIREMCRDEPYRIYELGSVEDLPSIGPADLRELHLRLLATAPLDVFMVGDVTLAQGRRMVGRAMRLKRGQVAMPPPAMIRPAPAAPREIVERRDVEQGHLVLGLRTQTTWQSEDLFDLSMANGVLGGFPHSKLFANVRERDNLAYAVHSSIDLAKGVMFITAGIDFAKSAEALRTIRQELEALQAGRITDDEMEKTRASLIGRVRAREDSPGSLIAAYHEMMWHGAVRAPEEIVREYRAVTRDRVAAAARRIGIDTIYFLTRSA